MLVRVPVSGPHQVPSQKTSSLCGSEAGRIESVSDVVSSTDIMSEYVDEKSLVVLQ